MLIITRRLNESIIIDGRIRVSVEAINGRVRLGIEAPRGMPIVREELLARSIRMPEPADTVRNVKVCQPLGHILADLFAGPLQCVGSVS